MNPTFSIENHFLPGVRQGRVTLPNGWRLSLVTGPRGSGVHGFIEDETFEVAILNPFGRMIDDILPHQTREQIRALMVRLSKI